MALQLVAASQAEKAVAKAEFMLNSFWDGLSDLGKLGVQQSLRCCGFKDSQDRLPNVESLQNYSSLSPELEGLASPQCPPGMTKGCAEDTFRSLHLFQDSAWTLVAAAILSEVVLASIHGLLVFRC